MLRVGVDAEQSGDRDVQALLYRIKTARLRRAARTRYSRSGPARTPASQTTNSGQHASHQPRPKTIGPRFNHLRATGESPPHLDTARHRSAPDAITLVQPAHRASLPREPRRP